MTYLVREAPITATDPATRTMTVQLLAWDDERPVTDPGRPPYRESWARGSLVPLDRLYVTDRHGGELIGRMAPPYDAGPGPAAEVTIARTRAGDDLLALVDGGVIDSVSIEALPDVDTGEVWSADRSTVTRTRGFLAGVAFAFYPAHDAPIIARQETPMSDTPAPETTDTPAPAVPASVDVLQAEMVELRRALTSATPAAPARPRFESVGELMHAAVLDTDRALPRDRMGGGVPIGMLERAFTDILTSNIGGLVPPQRLAEFFDVIAPMQPLVEAAGTAPPPESMTYEYPKIGVRPLVGAQATQKTEVSSRVTSITTGTATVQTLAGGNDVSVQAIQLSRPSFLEVLAQLYAEEMARATDAAAYAAYDVAATVNSSIGVAATGWNQAFFNMAATIYTGSKRWPDRIGLAPDLWAKVGGAADATGRPLFTANSPSNPVGTATLSSPSGDIRDMSFFVDSNFPADRGVMFASSAFRVALGPVQTLTVDVPRLLGRDIAVFRFAAVLPIDGAAMALFATGTAPTVLASKGKAKD